MRLKICVLAILLGVSFTASAEMVTTSQLWKLIYTHASSPNASRGDQSGQVFDDTSTMIDIERQLISTKPSDEKKYNALLQSYSSLLLKDTAKGVDHKKKMDSLRLVTHSYPVAPFHRDTLFSVWIGHQGLTAEQRAADISAKIRDLAALPSFNPDSIELIKSEKQTTLKYGDKELLIISDEDALWIGGDRDSIALRYKGLVADAVVNEAASLNRPVISEILVYTGIAIAAIAFVMIILLLIMQMRKRNHLKRKS
jgi:hypothetical protein